MKEMIDIYDSKPGDILHIPCHTATQEEILGELLLNNLLGTVEEVGAIIGLTDDPVFVVKVLPQITTSQFARMLVVSRFAGEDKLNVAIPSNINPDSLRQVMYVLMREYCVAYTLRVAQGVLKARIKPGKVTGEGMHVRSLISKLSIHGEIKNITRPPNIKMLAFTQSLRREAIKQGLKVRMNCRHGLIDIRLDDTKCDYENPNTVWGKQKMFDRWADYISYDVPLDIPKDITDAMGRQSIMTCIHKSSHDISLIKKTNTIIKYSARIKKYNGMYSLMVKGKCLKKMTTIDPAVINLLLVPYGLTYEDVAI